MKRVRRMPPALLLVLLGTAAPVPASAERQCLPGADGFIAMRLQGSIDEDIRWAEPELACTGMARPDGRGLRLRFAAEHGGGELAVLFAAPDLGIGASGRGVPVNVTVLDGPGERIYGTQGEERCTFDEVEQRLLAVPGLPPRSYRVTARGFCVAPARALDGDGAVLLSRFDFAGFVSWQEDPAATGSGEDAVAMHSLVPAAAPVPAPEPDLFPQLRRTELAVKTAAGSHRFTAWIADDDRSRARGLMFVRALPPDTGMLFVFDRPQFAGFWMKNTYLSLDLVFIAADGTVVNVVADAKPLSLDPIESAAPVRYVLELVAGTAARIGLDAGDRVILPDRGNVLP